MFPPPVLAWVASTAQQSGSPQAGPQAAELVAQAFDLLGQHEPARAAEAFRKAIEVRPELADAHRGLGLALWVQGRGSAALQELRVATRLAPEDAEGHVALGRLAWALSLQPELARDRTSRLGPGDYQELAITEMGRALALRPEAVEIRLNLADLYLNAGRPQEALPEASSAVRQAPASDAAHVTLGRAYFAAREEDKAESEFKAALAIQPANG
ncbi:MAG: tetratricopeptide repeat protein [Acidobacteriia bacterium]|nr:tetratricopeptide repeat protein [Terriglobia bacterium]